MHSNNVKNNLSIKVTAGKKLWANTATWFFPQLASAAAHLPVLNSKSDGYLNAFIWFSCALLLPLAKQIKIKQIAIKDFKRSAEGHGYFILLSLHPF